jgi:transposase InsO family protein
VQIVADTSIPALYVTRVLDQARTERGLPRVIRTDNGPEFAGRTMQGWAAQWSRHINRPQTRAISRALPDTLSNQ